MEFESVERLLQARGSRRRYRVTVTAKAVERLSTKCFRGRDARRAGNFFRWEHAAAFLEDAEVQERLTAEFEHETASAAAADRAYVEFDYGAPVGWSCTDDIRRYPRTALERHAPNLRSTVWRVRADCTHLLAPATSRVTLRCEFRVQRDGTIQPTVHVIVHTVYAGSCVGPMGHDGTDRASAVTDVSAREGMAFFDWNHPAERLNRTSVDLFDRPVLP